MCAWHMHVCMWLVENMKAFVKDVLFGGAYTWACMYVHMQSVHMWAVHIQCDCMHGNWTHETCLCATCMCLHQQRQQVLYPTKWVFHNCYKQVHSNIGAQVPSSTCTQGRTMDNRWAGCVDDMCITAPCFTNHAPCTMFLEPCTMHHAPAHM